MSTNQKDIDDLVKKEKLKQQRKIWNKKSYENNKGRKWYCKACDQIMTVYYKSQHLETEKHKLHTKCMYFINY